MNSESIVKVNQIALELVSIKYSKFLKDIQLTVSTWNNLFENFCVFIWQNDWYMSYVNFLEFYIELKW